MRVRLPARRAILGDTITDIVQVRAEKEMCRIDAALVVTPVQHVKPVRYLTMRERPCDAMRGCNYSLAKAKGTVAKMAMATTC